jgi:hypothetical protein
VFLDATNVRVVQMALASVAAAEALSATPDPLLAVEPKGFGASRDPVLVRDSHRDTGAPESPVG